MVMPAATGNHGSAGDVHDVPILSIITPSYNHAPYIRQTIESVLAQEYPRVEHIVIDGASTDGTPAILAEYAARHPERFRYRSAPDRGQSDAFNRGLALARGEFVGWQNSDDYYLPGAFAAPVAYLQAHPDVAAVYGGCLCVNDKGILTGKWPVGPFDYMRQLNQNYIPNQSAFFRRAALEAVGGLDVDLHYTMDYDLWLRLGLSERIEHLAGTYAVYRILATAKTQAGMYHTYQETVTVVERAIHDPRFPGAWHEQGRQALVRHIFEAVAPAITDSRHEVATALLQKALRYDPDLAQGDYLVDQVLNYSRAYANLPVDAAVPERAQGALADVGLGQTPYARQLGALAHLYRASEARRAHDYVGAAAALARALEQDRAWLGHSTAQILLLRMFLPPATVNTLRALVRSRHHARAWMRESLRAA